MACKHCRQPIERCTRTGRTHPASFCKGWVHAADNWHLCLSDSPSGATTSAEPPASVAIAEGGKR